jgi:uncharacterized RDD family membrane protein YckC
MTVPPRDLPQPRLLTSLLPEPPLTIMTWRIFVLTIRSTERFLPVKLFQVAEKLHPSSFREMIRIGSTESFKVTFTGRIFFTGFECKKEAAGMVLADTGRTAPE